MLRHLGERGGRPFGTSRRGGDSRRKYVTYDLKADRNDPTAVGTSEMADAIIAKLEQN